MIQTEFTEALRNFRQESEGAACFFDPVRNKHFCANRLTREQAEAFAQENDLQLKSWRPGESCSGME